MNSLLARYSSLIRLLRKYWTSVTIENVKDILDEIVSYLNKINNKQDGFYILTIICHEFTSINTLKIFNNPIIIDHQLFVYIGRTFEMLLTKSNHSHHISMTKVEEDCFYATSYFIAYLCLYRNEPLIHIYSTQTPNDLYLSCKQNCYESQDDWQKQYVFDFSAEKYGKSYQEIFLRKQCLDKFIHAIEDLSVNEYKSYHVKYKVVDRLIRLCSKLNIVNSSLLDAIAKCLCSKYYLRVLETVDICQPIFDPKQSFFIRECPEFIIQHSLNRQDKIAQSLCKTIFGYTETIFNKHLQIILNGEGILTKNQGGEVIEEETGARMQALVHHIKLLNYFASTPSTRKEFISSQIIDQILKILTSGALVDNIYENEQLFHVDVGVTFYSIILLYNLVLDQQLFTILEQKNVAVICERFHSAKDRQIQFASQTLSAIITHGMNIDEINDP